MEEPIQLTESSCKYDTSLLGGEKGQMMGSSKNIQALNRFLCYNGSNFLCKKKKH